MNREEAHEIIAAERLGHTNLGVRTEPIADEVGILETATGFLVYVTDERAAIRTADEFDDESEALKLFVRKARLIERVLAPRPRSDGRAG